MTVFAVVPVKELWRTKSRLEPILDPGARAGLTLYMMGRVVSALRTAGIENVCVVSPDHIVLEAARKRGAASLRQESRGLNPALDEGRLWAMERGASALLVLPADLPLLDAGDVQEVLDGIGTHAGTNALLLRPPDALPFAFGPDSYESHLRAARERGLDVRVRERPHLAFDLDTADDLTRLKGRTGVPNP